MKTTIILLGTLSIMTRMISCVDAFASYMTTKSGCMIDLDTTEVVMNNPIQASKPWNESAQQDSLKIIVTSGDAILPVESSLDDNSIPPDRAVILLDTLPTTVVVKIEGDVPDAQYVLQAGTTREDSAAAASFTNGGQCDGNARWSGRVGDEGAELTIHAEHAQVWAGWAAGHEAVKLLPGYIFRLKNNEIDNNENSAFEAAAEGAAAGKEPVKTNEQEWTAFMTTEVGCTSIQLSDSPAEILQRNVVTTSEAGKLSPGDSETVDGGVAYHIEFETSSTRHAIHQVVVEVTAGASFSTTFHTAQIACAGERIVWSQVPSDNFVVGTLTVKDSSEASKLYIRAIYSVQGEDSTLYMTPTLTIKHVPESDVNALVDDQSDMERQKIDPQKALEQALKQRASAQNLHGQVQAHNERIKRSQPNDAGDRKQQIHDQIRAKHEIKANVDKRGYDEHPERKSEKESAANQNKNLYDQARDSLARRDRIDKKNHEDHPQKKAEQKKEINPDVADQVKARIQKREQLIDKRDHTERQGHKKDLSEGVLDLHDRIKTREEQKLPRDKKLHERYRPHAVPKEELLNAAASKHTEDSVPTVAFDAAYLSAAVIFVFGTAAAFQIFRYASRRGSKGRRDL